MNIAFQNCTETHSCSQLATSIPKITSSMLHKHFTMIIKRYIISLFFFLCINPIGCVQSITNSMVNLHRFVVKLGLQLLGISHFPDSFHEIFLNYEVMIGTDRKHPCFSTDISQVCSVEAI